MTSQPGSGRCIRASHGMFCRQRRSVRRTHALRERELGVASTAASAPHRSAVYAALRNRGLIVALCRIHSRCDSAECGGFVAKRRASSDYCSGADRRDRDNGEQRQRAGGNGDQSGSGGRRDRDARQRRDARDLVRAKRRTVHVCVPRILRPRGHVDIDEDCLEHRESRTDGPSQVAAHTQRCACHGSGKLRGTGVLRDRVPFRFGIRSKTPSTRSRPEAPACNTPAMASGSSTGRRCRRTRTAVQSR